MRSLFGSMLLTLLAGPAWAQTAPVPQAPPSSPMANAPVQGSGGALMAAALVFALLVIVGIAVKIFDTKRKREGEAVQLQSQVSDALLRDPAVFELAVTPTAHVPMFGGSPTTVELTGQVPSPEARERVLRIVIGEAARIRPDVRIEDKLSIGRTARAA
jgi:hypothetical protein